MSKFNQEAVNKGSIVFGMEGYTPTLAKINKKGSQKVAKDKTVPLSPPKKP